MQQTNKESSNSIELFETMVFALSFLVVVFIFCFRIVVVSGPSMNPTLNDADRILIQSAFYTPKANDVVIIDSYTKFGKPIVKRIIAVGGDEVYIDEKNGDVYVNKTLINEPYIQNSIVDIGDNEYPITVPKDMIFVMGDNRQNSLDSRFAKIGFIDKRDILGKVLLRIYPFNDVAIIK